MICDLKVNYIRRKFKLKMDGIGIGLDFNRAYMLKHIDIEGLGIST